MWKPIRSIELVALLVCLASVISCDSKTARSESNDDLAVQPKTLEILKSKTEVIGKTTYRILKVKPERIRMFWKPDGSQSVYGSFRDLYDSFPDDAKPLAIMNAGIYEPDYSPTGLYVQNGETLSLLNADPGKGNFFQKPNGVFYIDNGKAKVVETSKYVSKKSVTWATQSGPLLLNKGVFHPKFTQASTSFKKRNGICVAGDGDVVMIVSEKDHPNMRSFAEAMKSLDCQSALYLDGTVSRLFVRGEDNLKPHSRRYKYAVLIAVVGE